MSRFTFSTIPLGCRFLFWPLLSLSELPGAPLSQFLAMVPTSSQCRHHQLSLYRNLCIPKSTLPSLLRIGMPAPQHYSETRYTQIPSKMKLFSNFFKCNETTSFMVIVCPRSLVHFRFYIYDMFNFSLQYTSFFEFQFVLFALADSSPINFVFITILINQQIVGWGTKQMLIL